MMRGLLLASLAGLTLITAPVARAADWPSRAITIVCPYGPGTSADRISRVISAKLSSSLKVPVIVKNRVGAGGLIGAADVAKAPPDGYTLLLSGMVQIFASFINRSPPVDVVNDFTQIAYVGSTPLAWAVYPASDIRSVPDAIKAAREGKLTQYATSQAGSVAHVLTELVTGKMGIKLQAIHYNSTVDFADVLEGRVKLVVTTVPNVLGFAQTGRLRVIGVVTEQRVPALPDVPTFKEQGIDAVADIWQSIAAPKGLPDDIADALHREIAAALTQPDVRARLANDLDGKSMTRQQLTRYFETETARLTPVLREVIERK